MSLVKGVQMKLKAIALSVKEGGEVRSIEIGGQLSTLGDQVTTLEIHGHVGHIAVAGGIHAQGNGSDAAQASGNVPGLEAIRLTNANG